MECGDRQMQRKVAELPPSSNFCHCCTAATKAMTRAYWTTPRPVMGGGSDVFADAAAVGKVSARLRSRRRRQPESNGSLAPPLSRARSLTALLLLHHQQAHGPSERPRHLQRASRPCTDILSPLPKSPRNLLPPMRGVSASMASSAMPALYRLKQELEAIAVSAGCCKRTPEGAVAPADLTLGHDERPSAWRRNWSG